MEGWLTRGGGAAKKKRAEIMTQAGIKQGRRGRGARAARPGTDRKAGGGG